MNNVALTPRIRRRSWLASALTWVTSGVNEIAVALWTSTSFYLMYANGGGDGVLLFLPLIVGAVVFLWLTHGKPVIARVDKWTSFGVFLLFFGILGSYLCNAEYYDLMGIWGNLISAFLLFLVLYLIAMKIDLNFRKLFIFQSIYINLLLPVVLENSRWMWGRLEPLQLQPNYPSMLGIVAFIGALATRNIFGIVILGALPLYTMIAMSSRGSMIATAIISAVVGVNYLWSIRSVRLLKRMGVIFLVGGIVSILLEAVGIDFLGAAWGKISDVMMLEDSRRGMDSGASGRSDLWACAFNLWWTHPIFGVGFKGHTQFMPEQLPAHNAYLGMLADTGLVGISGYFIIVGAGVFGLMRHGSSEKPMFGFFLGIIASYFVYGLIETRAFSFGNTYSVLFFLVIFECAKRHLKPETDPDPIPSTVQPTRSSFAEPVGRR